MLKKRIFTCFIIGILIMSIVGVSAQVKVPSPTVAKKTNIEVIGNGAGNVGGSIAGGLIIGGAVGCLIGLIGGPPGCLAGGALGAKGGGTFGALSGTLNVLTKKTVTEGTPEQNIGEGLKSGSIDGLITGLTGGLVNGVTVKLAQATFKIAESSKAALMLADGTVAGLAKDFRIAEESIKEVKKLRDYVALMNANKYLEGIKEALSSAEAAQKLRYAKFAADMKRYTTAERLAKWFGMSQDSILGIKLTANELRIAKYAPVLAPAMAGVGIAAWSFVKQPETAPKSTTALTKGLAKQETTETAKGGGLTIPTTPEGLEQFFSGGRIKNVEVSKEVTVSQTAIQAPQQVGQAVPKIVSPTKEFYLEILFPLDYWAKAGIISSQINFSTDLMSSYKLPDCKTTQNGMQYSCYYNSFTFHLDLGYKMSEDYSAICTLNYDAKSGIYNTLNCYGAPASLLPGETYAVSFPSKTSESSPASAGTLVASTFAIFNFPMTGYAVLTPFTFSGTPVQKELPVIITPIGTKTGVQAMLSWRVVEKAQLDEDLKNLGALLRSQIEQYAQQTAQPATQGGQAAIPPQQTPQQQQAQQQQAQQQKKEAAQKAGEKAASVPGGGAGAGGEAKTEEKEKTPKNTAGGVNVPIASPKKTGTKYGPTASRSIRAKVGSPIPDVRGPLVTATQGLSGQSYSNPNIIDDSNAKSTSGAGAGGTSAPEAKTTSTGTGAASGVGNTPALNSGDSVAATVIPPENGSVAVSSDDLNSSVADNLDGSYGVELGAPDGFYGSTSGTVDVLDGYGNLVDSFDIPLDVRPAPSPGIVASLVFLLLSLLVLFGVLGKTYMHRRHERRLRSEMEPHQENALRMANSPMSGMT